MDHKEELDELFREVEVMNVRMKELEYRVNSIFSIVQQSNDTIGRLIDSFDLYVNSRIEERTNG
jgi:hypothetical protein